MKNKILLEKLTSAIYNIAIFLFLIAFNFLDTPPPGGWYQQFIPNLNGRSINDVFFLDSLTGYAVTNSNGQYDTAFVLKTTNGGDNWFINYLRTAWFTGFNKVKFLNPNTGFICGVSVSGGPKGLTKTTNGGINWFDLNIPDPYLSYLDMSVLNVDTIWLVCNESLTGGVFRTTNGGLNWTQQFSGANENPNKIYMYNARIGFISNTSGGSPNLRKTTNGGENWSIISANERFTDLYFTDSLTGWKAFGTMKKTTNGGLNWINQPLPQVTRTQVIKLAKINIDTIWGSGGYIIYPNSQLRGILYRTTNQGTNWLIQIPDTSIKLGEFDKALQFINNKTGWVYSGGGGIHTLIGGDTTFYTGILQINSEVPKSFELKQNFPNPFNPRTVIPFSLKKSGYVKLIAYDITGKEIQVMVDGYQQAGEYNVDFMGKFTPSGVYFYRLVVSGANPMEVTDERTNQLFSETKKMILLK